MPRRLAPPTLPKVVPTLRAELEEIEGAGDLEHGDEVTLQAHGTVTEMSTRNEFDHGGKTTTCVIELSDLKVIDKDLRKSTSPPSEDVSGLRDREEP